MIPSAGARETFVYNVICRHREKEIVADGERRNRKSGYRDDSVQCFGTVTQD